MSVGVATGSGRLVRSVPKSLVAGDLLSLEILFRWTFDLGGFTALWRTFLVSLPSLCSFFISILLYFKFMNI